ncbi:UNVERIFIED_ORG: hypothetical protein JN05_03046 [Zoogloea ramigera]|uniref:BrnT family toxin n=1 Tax=Duganella zoogloeoides TaxID=75659 RepID=A0ABZ0Y388_9BURK|nr:BrnT family toxin [Duganella zoogloeoides]WQH05872.1 BrnT family toxin [Duganella zoogloeoides]
MHFEWDSIKATANLRKHGVSIEEASTVFTDMSAREAFDHLHSDDEDRFHLLGISENDRLLVVSYCYRRNSVVRIISAREAQPREKIRYMDR